MGVSIDSEVSRSVGRAAEDVGLAALLGGNLFGRLAMHPALAGVSDSGERGKVVNSAWRRYGFVNSLALSALVAGWLAGRDEAEATADPQLVRAKDAAVAAVGVTGIAAAIQGLRFGRSAPGGAVPLASGSQPSAETPPEAARLKRALNALGGVSTVAELALVGVNAALARERPRRRRLRR